MPIFRTVLALALWLCTNPVLADPTKLDFGDPGWVFEGDGTRVEEAESGAKLHIRSGAALRRDIKFMDGTIEFDMRVTSCRSFVFLRFRMETDEEHEEFYFRPHKSGLPDAIQYTPVFHGAGQWQLYHAAGSTAAAEFSLDGWVHVRIVLDGSRAAVFVGEVEEPQLIVPRLAREPRPGYISLVARKPIAGGDSLCGSIAAETASFANLVIRPEDTSFDFSIVDNVNLRRPKVVREWSVSQSFDPGEGAILHLPPAVLSAEDWTTLSVEPLGFVALARHRAKPEGVRRAAVLAKLSVHTERAGSHRFNFGYSDEVSVFLNGELLFSADNRYSFNFPRRQGLISLDQASLYLPLRQGPNELILAVTDVFGGWGVMGQFVDGEVRVTAP